MDRGRAFMLIMVVGVLGIVFWQMGASIISDFTLSGDKEIHGWIEDVYQERSNLDVRVSFQDGRIFNIQKDGVPAYINNVYAMIKSNEGNNVSIFYKTDAFGNNRFQYLKED